MTEIFAKHALTPNGWETDVAITIDAVGRIGRVAAGIQPNGPAHDLILPAPMNLHSHSFQRAMAGLTETRGPDATDSFWTWRRLMYRFLDRLTPDNVEAIAAQVFLEMLESGFASVAEFHYLHHAVGGVPYDNIAEMAERIVAAARQTGIGLTLLPVLYSHGGCDGRDLQGGQLRFGNDFDRYEKLFAASHRIIKHQPDDYRIGAAPHSLRAVDRGALSDIIALYPDGPIHMHLAEQIAEVEEVQTHWGARPVEWLLNTHEIDARWCLIHCTQMTDTETRALSRTGAVAGLCPITESSLGDGIFNGVEYVSNGGKFGIGSDSNIHIDLFTELATLEYSQRLRDKSRAALATQSQSTGRVLYARSAKSGAQAGGRPAGEIAAGQFADLVALSSDNPCVCGRVGDAALDSLIFAGNGRSCITDVWSAGRHTITQGRHPMRDAIRRRFMDTVKELGQDI